MKKILVSLLCAVMIVTFMPAMAFAEETAAGNGVVAQIGDKTYDTFAEAYAEAGDNDTITLLANAEWTASGTSVAVTKNLTIDLANYNLELERDGKETGFYLYLTGKGKNLTIKGNGGSIETANSSYLVRLYGGNLKLESGTLIANNATRTVYVSSDSTFAMTGGALVNGSLDVENKNSNVLEVSAGTANISGGTITSTGGVPCAKVSNKSATLNISGTPLFSTTADRAIWNNSSGNLTISGGSFGENYTGAAVYVTGSNGNSTANISANIPSLMLSSTGVVTIAENVKIEKVKGDEESVTFSAKNDFTKGIYGNDFTDNIIGNGFICKKNDDDIYEVVQLEETDDRVVAIVTHSDNTKSPFGEFGAAMTALQNGDTLRLMKDVNNTSTSSYKSTASNVTVDLNGHSITAENASYGLWFNPGSKDVTANDTVSITGNGTIIGKNYAVYASTNGSSSTSPTYTVSIGSDVSLNTITEDGHPVGLMAQQTRLYMEKAPADYAAVTNGRAMTTIGNKTYIYAYPVKAINEQSESGGIVTLLGPCTVSDSNSANTAVNQVPVVLDLGNNTLTLTGRQGLIANGADLTIQNGTIDHTYAKSSEKSYAYAIGTTEKGKNDSSLTLKNVVVNEKADYAVALTVNGSLTGNKVTLENSEIRCSGTGSTVGIYFPVKDGTLDIVDSKITAMNAVQLKGGATTVKGDKTEIVSTGSKADPGSANSGCTDTGDGIYMEDNYGFKPTLSVESGVVKSTNGNALNYYKEEAAANAEGKIEAIGGIYSSDVKDYVPDGKTEASITSGGTTLYHVGEASDVAETLSETAKSGDEIDVQKGDLALTGVTGGVKVSNTGSGQVSVNNAKVETGKPVTTVNTYYPVTPTAQKPTIETSEGAIVTLNSTGTTAVITVADGYELVDVTVNGVSKGKATTLTGLKTGDKVVVTAQKIEAPDDNTALIEAVKNTRLVARSMLATAPSGKKSIKVYWFNKDGSELNFDGYEVYRSLKKNSGYGKKPIFKTTKARYFNTAIKKGTKYYYKVRAYKVIDGEKIYTPYSLKAWRTAK